MSAEVAWEPGVPFMPDNGCGTVPTISMSPPAREATMAEDDTPPPWYRPYTEAAAGGWNRHCQTCNVQWRGDDPCWMCGGQENQT